MNARYATRELAEFASGPLELPRAVVTMAKQTIANALALAVGAAHEPAVEIVYDLVRALRTPEQATIFGRDERVGAGWAALLNGVAVHVEDFDDTHLPTVLHPGAPIVPAAFAMAEVTGASGRTLLEAVAAGMEVAMRVGNGICPSHFDRAWHVTGTMGHLGAAVAAGRVAGLNAAQMQNALGLAALEAAGLTSANGTMTKSFHPGKAAFDGVEAVMLAQAGFTAPERAIEGARGLAVLTSETYDEAAILNDLATRWEMTSNAFKPYACGIVSHPIIDAAIAMRAHFTCADEIERIDVRCHPVVLDVMGKTDPRTGLETKFSAYHCAAVGFLDGAAGPKQFSGAYAQAPHVVALRRKVRVETTRDVRKGAAEMTVLGVGGQTVRHVVEHAVGSAERPMTDAEIEAKAILLAGEAIRPLLDLIAGLETADRIETLLRAVPQAQI